MDTIAFGIGLVVGMVGAAAAIEIGQKWLTKKKITTNLTHFWSISEIDGPVVAAKEIEGVNFPAGTRIVTAAEPDAQTAKRCKVRINKDVDANFVVGSNRALILSGALKPGTAALWTVDEEMIAALKSEFDNLWQGGSAVPENMTINEALAKSEGEVKVRGLVSLVTKYKDDYHILQISEEGGASVGILVDSFPEGIVGKAIEVVGTVDPFYGGGVIRPRQIRVVQ